MDPLARECVPFTIVPTGTNVFELFLPFRHANHPVPDPAILSGNDFFDASMVDQSFLVTRHVRQVRNRLGQRRSGRAISLSFKPMAGSAELPIQLFAIVPFDVIPGQCSLLDDHFSGRQAGSRQPRAGDH